LTLKEIVADIIHQSSLDSGLIFTAFSSYCLVVFYLFIGSRIDLLSVDLVMCVCLYATLNLTKGLWVRVIVSNREPIGKCVWRVDC